ncbi:beta-propeller fold lactonase family protein [Curtobacterium sp. MCSS17_007]|uniref:lactonase family protein n=1 Tax=Curtobacterium sp. MCSS17_007 TaxID=2175646 RepID=UPI0015E8E555|nr:beta-propeller fold lactonase family protein [Curtobacterium sp. MCSS17_007]WIE76165.1 beta-propeller fold lactonase family protein [Curtobacterium sp. MCSS17_007]
MAQGLPADLADLHLLVGSYTATGGGTATGISVVHGTTAHTAAVMDDPSFLALSGDRVYAVSEVADGSVSAFRYAGGALEHLWDADAGGDAPCHVRIDPSGALVVTNYVSGTVTAVSLEAAESHAASMTASDGVVGAHGSGDRIVVPDTAVVTGVLPDVEGPVEARQEGPHAHQSIGTPDGTVLVADLGGDALHEFRVTGTPSIELVRVHHLAPGVGPRHMVWLGDGPDADLVVAGELDGRIHRLRRDDSGTLRPVASAAAFDGPVGESLLSHVEIDAAGRVVVAVRGRDLVVVLDTADDGLTVAGSASCGGVWPRHFAQVPGYLLVANQMSDAIAVLPIGADGVPGAAVAQIAVGTPACIVPVPTTLRS